MKMQLKDRDNGITVSMPLPHLRAILLTEGGEDIAVGKALKHYIGKLPEGGAINDLEHLKGICNWAPRDTGITPIELARRMGLAGKLITLEKKIGTREIILTDDELALVLEIINNPEYQVRPSDAYWAFLIDFQKAASKPIFKEKESPKEQP